ncbi:hypothetical protein HMI55_001666 [Coelomomyces lativittatus]|nr:hypothetical protein HMI55_001666 [Coelomomyces lativittatus]
MMVMTYHQLPHHVPFISRWFEHRQVFVISEWVPPHVQEYHRFILSFVLPSVSLCVDGSVKLSFSGKAIVPSAFFTLYQHPQDDLKIHHLQWAMTHLRTTFSM